GTFSTIDQRLPLGCSWVSQRCTMEASEDALNHYSRDSLLTENTQSLEYRRYRTSTWLVRAETHVSFLWALRVFHAGRPFFSCAYPLTLWGSGRNGFILPSR